MRVRSRSRFSRAISAAWSAGDGSGGAPAATARERAAPVWMAARQFRSIDGEMPASVATCIKGRPLLFKQRNGLSFEFGSELPPRFGHPNTFPAQPSVSKVSTNARDHQAIWPSCHLSTAITGRTAGLEITERDRTYGVEGGVAS